MIPPAFTRVDVPVMGLTRETTVCARNCRRSVKPGKQHDGAASRILTRQAQVFAGTTLLVS